MIDSCVELLLIKTAELNSRDSAVSWLLPQGVTSVSSESSCPALFHISAGTWDGTTSLFTVTIADQMDLEALNRPHSVSTRTGR